MSSDPLHTSRPSPWLTAAALTIASLPLLYFTLKTGIHGDVWWDWATGQWIWHHHAVPVTDPWSWSRRGHVWFAHEWLLNLMLYAATRWWGMAGIVLWSIVPGVLLMSILWRWQTERVPAHYGWHALWLVGASWILAAFYGHRPQDWAYPLLVWWLFVLDRYRRTGRSPWAVWSLPVVMLFWVNAHGSFFLGMGFLVFSAAWAFITPQGWMNPRARWTLTILAGLSILATWLNPHGWSLWPAMLALSQGAGTAASLTGEWYSPNFHYAAVALAYMAILALSVLAIWVGHRRPRWFDGFYWLGFYFAALHNQRFLADAALWFPVWMATYGSEAMARLPWRTPWRRMSRFVLGIWGAVTLIAVGFAVGPALHGPLTAHALQEPVGAVAWMKHHHETTRVFNDFSWGGYLIAQGIAPWMDGRGLLFGSAPKPSIARQYRTVVFLSSGNPWPILRRWHPDVFLLPPSVPLAGLLASQPHWHVAYRTAFAEVIVAPAHWATSPIAH